MPPPEEMLDIVHGGIRLRSNELVGVSKGRLEERLGNLAVQAPMDPGDMSESQDCVPSNIEMRMGRQAHTEIFRPGGVLAMERNREDHVEGLPGLVLRECSLDLLPGEL